MERDKGLNSYLSAMVESHSVESIADRIWRGVRQHLSCIMATVALFFIGHTVSADKSPRWVQSYDAGYVDANGAFAGGSEIMHLAAHRRKLFAANGYWMDGRWSIPPEGQKQSAQVLRLDTTDGQWQVDLDTGETNEFGLEYMKGNILKSVTFARDASGNLLAQPQSLLVMAAGARFDRGGAVSAWVRSDDTGKWHHTLVRHGSAVGGVRWVPRGHAGLSRQGHRHRAAVSAPGKPWRHHGRVRSQRAIEDSLGEEHRVPIPVTRCFSESPSRNDTGQRFAVLFGRRCHLSTGRWSASNVGGSDQSR